MALVRKAYLFANILFFAEELKRSEQVRSVRWTLAIWAQKVREQMTATNDRLHDLKTRGIHEFKRFAIMFIYLWVVFGLFALNQAVIMRNMGYLTHGFALMNAAIFAKVMLIVEDLKFGDRFQSRPLIYPVIYKTVVFSIVFLFFHVLEEAIAASWKGESIADRLPHIGSSELAVALCVWGILSISLIPFFAVREISRVLGEHELWNVFFRHRRAAAATTQQSVL